MGKQTYLKKQTQVQNQHGNGIQQEHTEVFDDNLLPEASEIERLQQLDPNILPWLKERAEKEQEFRHITVSNRDKIVNNKITQEVRTNRYGMTLAFIIILVGMIFSAYLISLGQIITGTIFSGFTIVYAAALFITRNSSGSDKPSNKK